jgi:hypothetical protein
MTTSRPGRAALVLLAVLLGGCVGSVPAGSPGPTPAPAASGSQGPEAPSPGEATPEPTLEPPPGATLVAGSAEAAGRVGSYVWAGGSDAAPWLPASALEAVAADAGGDARVEIAGDVEVATWTARAAPANDPTGEAVTPLGSGSAAPSFELPAEGAWVVSVEAVFAGGRGDATWYWRLVLD